MPLFSELYIPRGAALRDDDRMRIRFAILVQNVNASSGSAVFGDILARLGLDLSWGGNYWLKFFQSAELKDVLDAITVIFDGFITRRLNREAIAWLEGVREIFDQQNAAYRVDGDATVHFREDAAMEALSISVITALSGPRYANVSRLLRDGLRHLDTTPIDHASSIRGVFLSTEELFKTMYASAPRLTGQFIDQQLKPQLVNLVSGNQPAEKALSYQFEGFKNWVNACHNYRHAEGDPKPQDPPHWLCIALVTEGLNFLRWLSAIDKQVNP